MFTTCVYKKQNINYECVHKSSIILGIKETKTEENDNLNEDIGISRDRQSYFRTTKGTVYL